MLTTGAILEQFERATRRLEEVLEQGKDEIIRDSAIKRFEFTFDLAWKLVKVFIEDKHGLICKSPKSCFKEAFKQGLIDYDDFWIDLTDLRNEVAHTYQEATAEKVYSQLPQSLSYFNQLLQAIKSQDARP